MGGNERERESERERERERERETERERESHSVKDWIMTIIFLVKCKDSCQNGSCVNRKENICKCDIGWSGRTCNSSTNGE